MKIIAFFIVALCSQTLAAENPIEFINYVRFGWLALIYGFAPLWAYKKNNDQTNNTIGESIYAPVNKMVVADKLSNATDAIFVSPNPNVLYGNAHLDLRTNSVRLHVVPHPNNDSYVYQVMDAFTNARPNWYITNTNPPNATMPKEGDFAFVYVKCQNDGTDGCSVPGKTDDGKVITIIETDMPFLWIVARYYIENDDDINAVKDAMAQSTLGVSKTYNVTNYNKHSYPRSGKAVEGMEILSDPIGALDNLNKWITYNGYGPISLKTRREFRRAGLKPN